MFLCIYKGDDHRKIAPGFDKMSGTHFGSAKEPSDGMKYHCSGDILFTQVAENLQMQRPVMP